jgi:hypothetical protein
MSGTLKDPAKGPSREHLKQALKAFKERLKVTRLDAESSISDGPLSGGRRADIVATTPPSRFVQAVWDELVRQGKLHHAPSTHRHYPEVGALDLPIVHNGKGSATELEAQRSNICRSSFVSLSWSSFSVMSTPSAK